MTKKPVILALFGKSGAGKDYIKKKIISLYGDKVNEMISCTTRPPRAGEENYRDYIFLSIEEFAQKVLDGSMLEATDFRGWFYGSSEENLSIDKINVGIFNIAGIDAILENNQLIVYPVYVDSDDKVRLLRSLNREDFPDCHEICRRFLTDEKDFNEMDIVDYYTIDNSSILDIRRIQAIIDTVINQHSWLQEDESL